MKNNVDLTPTPSQTVGPFFHLGCTETHSVRFLAGEDAKGERVRVTCRVFDGEGVPIPDAMIEIWQADSQGRYNHPADLRANGKDPDCSGFGRLATDKDGQCVFETIKPGRVPMDDDLLQAPHMNVSVFARGVLKRLATRIYFNGEPANAECPILTLVPEDRRATLMAHPDARGSGNWRFDIHLCGAHETVFFDV
ncbi:MAG: protocatechuate 3,4-dioxygenase subunit alpha [Candidatus Sulfotelmatobacter sp.]